MREGTQGARSIDIERKAGSQGLPASESAVLEMVARGRPLSEVLEALTRAIERQANGLVCSVLVLEEESGRLRHGAAPSLPESFHQAIDGIDIGPGTTPCGAAAHSGERVIASDLTTDPLWAHNKSLALQYGLRACWSVPIKSGAGKVLGTFALYDAEPRMPSASDFELIDRAQHLAAIALERNRAEAELVRSEKRLRVIGRARAMTAECNRALVRTTDENLLLQEMCRIGVESGGYRVAWIGLARHDAQKTVEPVAKAGDHEGYFESVKISWADDKHGSGPAGMAVRTGKPQVARHTASDPAFKAWRNEALARGYLAVVALPLMHEGETFGVFGLFAGESDAFGPDEIALLEELANDIAYGVYNLRTREAHRQSEAEVDQSEQRFHATFDLVPVGINHIDVQGRILLANPRFGQMLGYAPNDLIGRGIREFVWPEDQEAAQEIRERRAELHAGKIQSFTSEIRYRHKDGSAVWVGLTIALQRDAGGDPLYDISAIEDITARKREERLLGLEHSIARCLSQADSASAAVREVIRSMCESEGWDSGRYFYWDKEGEVLRFGGAWGIASGPIQEFIRNSNDVVFRPGEGLAGLVWQSGQALWIADINNDPRALRAAFSRNVGIRGAFVFPVVAEEGKALGILAFSSREIRQPDERLLGTVHVIGSQIGQFLLRKQAEEVLRGSEERFRSLTDLSSDMYWEQDDQYRFTSSSGSGPEWIVKGRRNAIGKKRWEYRYVNMTEKDWVDHMATLDARKPFRDLELCRVHETGRKIWISVSGEPVFDPSGAFKGYRGVGKDITSRKRAEQLQALEHAVNRSLTNVDNVADAVRAAIRAICETEGWECGRYFRCDEGSGTLRFSHAWGIADAAVQGFIAKSRALCYASGEGLAGRVWQTGEPIWAADLTEDTRPARTALAREMGMRGAFVFPVISEGKTLGVLAFNTRKTREPEEPLLQTIRVIGTQVGQFLQRKRGEEELRRFRAAMDVSAEMIWLIDPVAMRIIDVNETACRKLNYSREELLAKGPQHIINVPRAELAGIYNRLIAGEGLETTIESSYSRKDGSRIPVEVFRRAVRSEEGHVIVAVGRDVTEQRAAQEELRRFRLAMDNSADMIVLIDRATMRFVDVNATATSLLGYSREEFLEIGPQDLLPVTRAELERSYDELIANPSLTSGMNTHYRRKDGTLLPFESTRRVLRSGDTYIIAAISRDVRERIAAETALRESNERFDVAVRATNDVIWDWNLVTDDLWWNQNFTKVFGYPQGEVQSTVKSWYEGIHPEDRDRVVGGTRLLIDSGGSDWADEYRFRRHDGTYAHVFDRGHVIRDGSGRAVRMIGAMADITARKQTEEKVRNQALRQRLIAEFGQQVLASADLAQLLDRAMALVSATLKAEYCNVLELEPEGKRLVFKATAGWPAEWIGRRSVSVLPGTPVEFVLSRREPLVFEDLLEETRFSTSPLLELGVRSGIQVPIYGTESTFGTLGAYSQQMRRFTEDDVSFLQTIGNILSVAIERKNTDDQLSYLAQFDSLTGLPNRHLFHDRLVQTMAQARRSARPMAVLFIDLDRFKVVNDTQGHGAGDKLLMEAAARLNQCVRVGDTVGRFGGDEFGAILSDLGKPGDASIVAQKIIDALARPFQLDGQETYVSGSVGITLFPADSEEAEALITNADAAMYRAKDEGRNTYQYFTREMNDRALARVHLEAALRRALERGEFLLHYQPKVDLESGAICGLEALLRWQHPERGMVSPVEFIPVLEDCGLIVPVGEWVMRSACGQIRVWQKSGLAVPPVAVNLSARQFQQKDLEPIVRSLLTETGVDPSLIQFELTESLLMKEPETAARTLSGLKKLGVKISVDDFGTGYSSLAYLKRFPIDSLKIDRAFIRELTTDPDDAAITLAIIGLAHSLKLRVVAEGVETEGQLNFLSSHACDEMQGYYFAKPAAPAELEAMLREGRQLQVSRDGVSAKPAVLLLDDSDQDLLLLEEILRSSGFPVLKTTDPKRAFELLAGHPVGIVISDQNMPGMTGVEFLSHVRKLYPNVLRIIATGAQEPKAVADAVNQAGIHRFLSKNWDRERLRAELLEAYRQHHPNGSAKFLRSAPLAA